jgi:acid phosphatase family membrane protein YuiD
MGCTFCGAGGASSGSNAMGLSTKFERIGIRDADDFLDVVEKQLKIIDDICSTVDNLKVDLLDETGLDEVPGAKLKHAIRGLIIGVIASSGT